MEKFCIGITFREPINSGPNLPEVFLYLEHTVVLNEDLILQLLEEKAMVVVFGLLDSI